MAAIVCSQHLGYGTPVSQHPAPGYTVIGQRDPVVVTQHADGSAGRTQIKAH
jgi:hypothetical protein